MYTISLIDWIMTTALIAASWQLYQVMQPRTPTADADRSHAPSASAEPAKTIVDSKPLDEMLQQIGRTGSFRSLDEFMQGAKLAYEAVVTAFAAGEIEPLAGWLGPAVRKALDDAIAERVARQETLSTTFIGFLAAEPVEAGLDGGSAWIDVRFVAQLVSVTTDREGRIVGGHPRRIDEVAEIWTFARETRSADPNWTLVATEADG